MTAPDSRYLDEAMARLAEAVAQPVGGSIVISAADACAIGSELRRLQALARGPQQAGGEDWQLIDGKRSADGLAYTAVYWCANTGALKTETTSDGRFRAGDGPRIRRPKGYAALQAEVARLQKIVAGELRIEELHMVNGRIDARLTTDMAKIMAQGYLDLCDEHGAQNYLQLHMADSQGREVYVTVQRGGHPTPHDLRMKAEAALREAGRDAERLDWLDQQRQHYRGLRMVSWGVVADSAIGIRAAIDAAIEQAAG